MIYIDIYVYQSLSIFKQLPNFVEWGRVDKLSPQEGASGADTVLRGSMRAPLGFSSGIPTAAKPQGLCPLSFAALGLLSQNPSGALTLPLITVSAPSTLSLGDSFFTQPLGFSTVAFTQFVILI